MAAVEVVAVVAVADLDKLHRNHRPSIDLPDTSEEAAVEAVEGCTADIPRQLNIAPLDTSAAAAAAAHQEHSLTFHFPDADPMDTLEDT